MHCNGPVNKNFDLKVNKAYSYFASNAKQSTKESRCQCEESFLDQTTFELYGTKDEDARFSTLTEEMNKPQEDNKFFNNSSTIGLH